MKRINLIPVLIVIFLAIAVFSFTSCSTSSGHMKHPGIGLNKQSGIHHFTKGEVLYPDYAHTDTLVVEDATSLNNAFDSTYNEVPATDGEISDVLHDFCHPYTMKWSDYGLDVDSTGYTIWDGDRQVAHIPFGKISKLDSIILTDND